MTQGLERRDFIRGGVLVAGAAAAALPEHPALAQSTSGTKPMTYEINHSPSIPRGSRASPKSSW
jgi:hypothetical protein